MTDTLVNGSARPGVGTVQPVPPGPVTEGLPDLVRWAEGMLLAPQHLQQNDLFWQEQLRFRLAQLAPYCWGVGALEIDPVKLKEGRVAVRRLECLMPDGTAVVFPGSFVTALEIDAAAALDKAPGPLRISLVVPARSAAATRRDASLRRYDLVRGALAIDENTGMGTVEVDRLRPRISLWAGTDIPAQYVACPLLELARRTDTRAIELRQYHPPLLRWQGADFLNGASLRKRLQLVANALWGKLRELAGERSDDGPEAESAAPGGWTDSARRLAAVLPQFTLVSQRPEARPAEVYDSLAQLVGVMAGFGANPIPPVLDAYCHDNCEPQFRRAIDYVVRKSGYIVTSYEFLEFEQKTPGRFTRLLPADRDEVLVELRPADGRAATAADQRALERWLADACIAVESLHPQALRSRVSARPHLLSPPELARRHLRASGAVFALGNEHIDLDGGRQSLLQPGQVLVIEGYAGSEGLQPGAILLHQRRGGRGPREGQGHGGN